MWGYMDFLYFFESILNQKGNSGFFEKMLKVFSGAEKQINTL